MSVDFNKIEDTAYHLLGIRNEDNLDREAINEYVLKVIELHYSHVVVSESDIVNIVKKLMQRLEIDMDVGLFIASNYRPWLEQRRKDIDWCYQDRYHRLLDTKLPSRKVIDTINRDTDQILNLTEDPSKSGNWSRKGLVVGHVQSGKTANYTGLMCKAADAGYKLIIILAGMSNDLRNQTQSRADEGFVGFDTGKMASGLKFTQLLKGVGSINSNFTPECLTTSDRDFNIASARQRFTSLSNNTQPYLAVIKKNKFSFDNLIAWLTSIAPSFDDIPLLLIDDEADHASINTNKPELDPTTINRKIKELLAIFPKNVYVGYTATPFANVFIDSNNEDIFPEDFIYSLSTPDNYIGPEQIFGSDDRFDMIRTIPIEEYFEDKNIYSRYIPLKHNKHLEIDELPPSLEEAIMVYVLTCTERNLRGQSSQHKSMMVNVSVFKDVQHIVKMLVYSFLSELKDAVSVNFALGKDALDNPLINRFHVICKKEFKSFDWNSILKELRNAISVISVIEVNTHEDGESLSYDEKEWPNGRSVIAIGGYGLSRGLTLEGLSTSYLLRNTKMYDTLMQMGRWFGYRKDYEDLCRIYLPEDAIDWYEYISEATEELREEFVKMRRARMTPRQFGLRVKRHPASLLITAANKMRSGQIVIDRAVDLTGRQIETSVLSVEKEDIDNNTTAAIQLIGRLLDTQSPKEIKSGYLFSKISHTEVMSFINSYNNHPFSHLTESKPIKEYIDLRAKEGEEKWDFLLVSSPTGTRSDIKVNFSGLDVSAAKRTVQPKVSNYITTRSKRFASANWETAGMSESTIKEIKAYYKKLNKRSIPGYAYREKRQTPLLVIYVLDCEYKTKEKTKEKASADGIVAWSMSFPGKIDDITTPWVHYVQNTVMQQQDLPFDNEEAEEEDYE